MKYKVGDIVEVIEVLPEWEIYSKRDKILNKPCKIVGMSGGLIMIGYGDGDRLCLLEERLRFFIPHDGNQLLFSFMR